MFTKNEVSDMIAELAGTTEMRAILQTTNQNIADLSAATANLKLKVGEMDILLTDMSPVQEIVEIDKLRSLIADDCPTDGVCTYSWFVRRTALGAKCSLSQVRRFVVDRFGVTYPVVTNGDTFTSAPQDGSWTEITGTFDLPLAVAAGVAEYYSELVYEGCFDDTAGRSARVRTPTLIFFVNEAN